MPTVPTSTAVHDIEVASASGMDIHGFRELMKKNGIDMDEAELAELFHTYDADNSGQITSEEAEALVHNACVPAEESRIAKVANAVNKKSAHDLTKADDDLDNMDSVNRSIDLVWLASSRHIRQA